MRPIKLKMSAFGAYLKPVELDFEKGLGDSNFFLIHGATGSGKTTILDAICYALYGESSGGGRKSSMMRSEAANPNEKTEVEFSFALRGKIYRIMRNPAYNRPKKHSEGLTEEKATAKIYENGRIIDTKDVSAYVEELLGFGKEQFRQVVMLPQGEFKKFLTSKSEDKQKVLNTLFNADFFKKIEDELKIKAANAKKTYDNLTERKKNLLEDTGAMEEKELPTLIEKLGEELNAAQINLKNLEEKAVEAQKKYSEGEILSKLFRDFEAKTKILVDAEEKVKQVAKNLAIAKTEFDKRTSEESLRENLTIQAAELAKKKDALKNLQDKQEKLASGEESYKKSVEKVNELAKLKTKCEELMLKLKCEVEKLSDSPAKLEIARQNLKNAQDREKLLAEIKNLRVEVAIAEKNLVSAQKSCEDAEKNLSDLREAQKSGSAARLAKNLEEGKPCPVCGAIHHPNPAISSEKIPTDAQIKAAEAKNKTLADKKSLAEKILSNLQGELKTKEKSLSEGEKTLTIAQAQADFDKISADVANLNKLNARIKNGEVKTRETEENLAKAQENDKKIAGEVANLRGVVDEMIRTIDEKYFSNPELLSKEILTVNQRLKELNAAFQAAQDNFNRLNRNLAAQKATLAAAEKNKAEISAQMEGKTPPDMSELKKSRDDTKTAEKSAVEAKTKLSERLNRIKTLAEKIFAINNELKTAEKDFLMWKTLSDAANGYISKISFQRYYLSTMFKEVIAEANIRLEKMSSGRYRFQNREETSGRERKAGLDLEIVDDYTGTARSVETLSGGESFLASLSLALGLAAVVQNNSGGIKLDTIFIDEGFGTLDSETLDFALKTLIELQNGGRLVGIISHVEELKKQIPVRLEVKSSETGAIAEFKHGLS